MGLKELSERIKKHLHRFEADPAINKPSKTSVERLRPYFHSGARHAGRYVAVWYASYQLTYHLTRKEAETYLAWLDAGNVGKHHVPIKKSQA